MNTKCLVEKNSHNKLQLSFKSDVKDLFKTML